MVGCGLVGLPRLVVAAAGEALLALPPALVRPWTCRWPILCSTSGGTGQPGDREAALADQQHAPLPRRPGRGREGAGLGRAVVRAANGSRAVKCEPSARPRPRSAPSATVRSARAVAGREVGDPPLPARGRDQDHRHDADAQRKSSGSNSSIGMIRVRGSGELKAPRSYSRSKIRRPGRLRNCELTNSVKPIDADLAAAVAQGRDLVDEVAVVADQDHVGLAVDERLGGALDGDVDDLALTAQRDRLEADREQRLDEARRHLGRGREEEQAGDVLVERPLGPLQQPVPPRPLLGTRTPTQDRGAQGGVDVLPVDEEVGHPLGHARTLPHAAGADQAW